MTPRVKIIEGTRSTATPMPLTRPTVRPTSRPTRLPSIPPMAEATMALVVSVQGTERSMWPRRMTIIIPAAVIPRKAPKWSCCIR